MVQQFMQKKYIQLILKKSKTKFCLSLHYNKENSYLFVNGKEIYKSKAREYEIKDSGIEI